MAARSGKSTLVKQAEQAGKQDHVPWTYTRHSTRSSRSGTQERTTGINGLGYHGQSGGAMKHEAMGGKDGNFAQEDRPVSSRSLALFDSVDIRPYRHFAQVRPSPRLLCSAQLRNELY
jgi:hypothetical protein